MLMRVVMMVICVCFSVHCWVVSGILVFIVEIPYHSSSAERLTLAEVREAKVSKPHILKRLKMFFLDGKYFLVNDPVYDITARWISEWALIVEEGIRLEFRCDQNLLSFIAELLFYSSDLWLR